MTSRQRFLAVLNGQMPDRVPVTLFIQDQGHFLEQMYPDTDPTDYEALQLKVIEIQKQFGVDVFVRMLFGINDPLGVHCGGLNVSQYVQTDIDGQSRPLYDKFDIGADEVFPIAGDFEPDEDVDVVDFSFWTNYWLHPCNPPDWCRNCDIDKNGIVNVTDFAKIAEQYIL
jgi:hypothetical protein